MISVEENWGFPTDTKWCSIGLQEQQQNQEKREEYWHLAPSLTVVLCTNVNRKQIQISNGLSSLSLFNSISRKRENYISMTIQYRIKRNDKNKNDRASDTMQGQRSAYPAMFGLGRWRRNSAKMLSVFSENPRSFFISLHKSNTDDGSLMYFTWPGKRGLPGRLEASDSAMLLYRLYNKVDRTRDLTG